MAVRALSEIPFIASVSKVNPEESFVEKAGNAGLEPGSCDAIDPELLGAWLISACRHNIYGNIEVILSSVGANEIGPTALGICFEALSNFQDGFEEMKKIAKANRFNQVQSSYVKGAFLNVVSWNEKEKVASFLTDYADHLSKKEILDALKICMKNDLSLSLFKQNETFKSLFDQKERSQKIDNEIREVYFLAIDYSRYDKLGEFAALDPNFKDSLRDLFAYLVKNKPLASFGKFLKCQWSESLSKNDLAIVAAGADTTLKFKTLLSQQRYNFVYVDGLICSKLSEAKARTFFNEGLQLEAGYVKRRVLGIALYVLFSSDNFTIEADQVEQIAILDWCRAFSQALKQGKQMPVVLTLLNYPELNLAIPIQEREQLFELAFETSQTFPENWAVAKALVQLPEVKIGQNADEVPGYKEMVAVRKALSQPLFDRCLIWIGKHNLVSAFVMFEKMKVFLTPNIFKEAFKLAAVRGHTKIMLAFLECGKQDEITSAEILEAFRLFEEDKENPALCTLLRDYSDSIEPEHCNLIFLLLINRLQESLLTAFMASRCLRHVSDENLVLPFGFLIALGSIKKENDDHDKSIALFNDLCPKITKLRATLDKIATNDRFSNLFKPDPSTKQYTDLWAIFVASSGLGLYTVAGQIHSRHKDKIFTPILHLAAMQTCTGPRFLVFYQKAQAVAFIIKPVPCRLDGGVPEEKTALLNFFLNAEWDFRGFNEANFKETKYPIIKGLLMTAVEYCQVSSVQIIRRNMKGSMGFDPKDLQEARELAKGNKELLAVLA